LKSKEITRKAKVISKGIQKTPLKITEAMAAIKRGFCTM
jgi:hypothetical protein